MRKRIFIFVLIILSLLSGISVTAESRDFSVYIDGDYLKTDVSPIISGGRLLIPLRALSEAVHAEISWNETDKSIELKKDGTDIYLAIGKAQASVNGKPTLLDAPPEIEDGNAMVPLRFIADALSYNIYYNEEKPSVLLSSGENPTMSVHFIDVGQGDSIFIILPDGKTMLIDGGNPENGKMLEEYIKANSNGALDYLVATHPHADHIGGLADVIKEIGADNFYMPKITANTLIFENMLTEIKNIGGSITAAKAGVVIDKNDKYSIEIIAPKSDTYKSLNDYSAVIMLTYGNRRFLFTGDAEKVSENEIIADKKADIKADVLKVGHHGSKTSTSAAFLSRVNPSVSVISVGKDNTYDHPSEAVTARLKLYGSEVFRTDILGTIKAYSDGDTLEIRTDALSPEIESTPLIVYVTKSGKKYHTKDCPTIKNSKNVTAVSFEDAVKKYSPCSVCKPAA